MATKKEETKTNDVKIYPKTNYEIKTKNETYLLFYDESDDYNFITIRDNSLDEINISQDSINAIADCLLKMKIKTAG